MSLTVHLPSVLAPLAGGQQSHLADGASVGEALGTVTGRFPGLAARLRDEHGGLYPFVTIYLNDEDIRFLGGFDAPVRDGDELTVVPAVAGG